MWGSLAFALLEPWSQGPPAIRSPHFCLAKTFALISVNLLPSYLSRPQDSPSFSIPTIPFHHRSSRAPPSQTETQLFFSPQPTDFPSQPAHPFPFLAATPLHLPAARPTTTTTNRSKDHPATLSIPSHRFNVAATSTTTRLATRSRGEEDETHNKPTHHEVDQKKKKKAMN